MRENTDQNNSEYGDFLRRNGLTKVLQMLRECHAEHLFGNSLRNSSGHILKLVTTMLKGFLKISIA